MEAIVIHPDSVEQLKTVKAVLKALNVRFEKQTPLPPLHIQNLLSPPIYIDLLLSSMHFG